MKYTKHENEKKRRDCKPRAKKVRNKISVLILRIFVAAAVIGIFIIAGTVMGAYLGILENAPQLDFNPKITGNFTTILYLDSTGQEIDRFDGGENREYASLDQMPAHLVQAFVSYEDERFYEHNGVDIRGLFRAVYVMAQTGDNIGASTITQQVIKNKLGLLKNTYVSKIQEQYLAIKYEEQLTLKYGSKEKAKNYILEVYLNSIGLGDGQVGVQAAAMHYFGKDVSELTVAESAVLACITQWPTEYAPTKKPEKNAIRKDIILKKMYELGYLTEKERDDAMAEDVYSTISNHSKAVEELPSYHSYFNDAVFEAVLQDLVDKKGMTVSEATNYIYNGGLSIYTTQNPAIQAIVDKNYLDESNFPDNEYAINVEYNLGVKNNITGKTEYFLKKTVVKNQAEVDAFIEKIDNELGGMEKEIVDQKINLSVQPQSSFVILDNSTGHVLAIAGSRGEKTTNRAFNRATSARRQPGSVFKVAASYAPAMDLGLITAASIIDDVPVSYGDWSPDNWDRKNPYQGLTTVREAITRSMNICAVKNMQATGITNCLNYLKNLGFKMEDTDYNLSTALGGITYGVSTLELAAGYATFANQGFYNKPVFYTKVLDHDGNILLENHPDQKQVLRKTTAYILTDIMKNVLTGTGGTGGSARFKEVKMPISGKTGTSTDDKDLTFVGNTPYYCAAIWLGYDTPKSMKSYGSVHLKLWSKIMEEIHQNLPYKDFEKPNGMTTAVICMESGKLAVEGLCDSDPRGSRVKTEIFEVGTAPTETCDVHRKYVIDKTTMKLATPYCPPEDVTTYVGIVRPIPYVGEKREMISDVQYEVPAALLNGVICDIHNGSGIPAGSDEPWDGFDDPFDHPAETPYVPTDPPLVWTPPPEYYQAPTQGSTETHPEQTQPPYTYQPQVPEPTSAPPEVTERSDGGWF